MTAVRWVNGERLAHVSADAEIVGLGYKVRPRGNDPFVAFDDDLHWVQLRNEAAESSMADEFYVSGEQLKATLALLLHSWGEGNVQPYVLWHSHLTSRNPSPFDYVSFPDWLVAVGAVYNTRSETTTLYTGSGVVDAAPPDMIAVGYGATHIDTPRLP